MNFARGTLGTFLAQLLIFGFGVATSIVIARVLLVEGRGAYAIAIKLAGISVAVAQLGLLDVLLYYVGDQRGQVARVTGTAVGVLILASGCSAGALFLSYPLFASSLYRGVEPILVTLAAASAPATLLFLVCIRVIQLRRALVAYNLLTGCKAALLFCATAGLLALLDEARQGSVLAFLAVEFGMALIALVVLRRLLPGAWHWDWGLARRMVSSGLVAQIGIVAIFVGSEAGIFIVNSALSLQAVGWYATGVGVARMLLFVSTSVRTVLQSRLPEDVGDQGALSEKTVLVARHTWVWLVLCGVALVAIGRPAINLLYGSEFDPAFLPLLLAVPGMVAYGLMQVISSYFIGVKRFWAPALTACMVAGLSVLTQAIAAPTWGIGGAAAALSLSYGLACVVYLAMFASDSRRPLWELLPARTDYLYYRELLMHPFRRQPAGGHSA